MLGITWTGTEMISRYLRLVFVLRVTLGIAQLPVLSVAGAETLGISAAYPVRQASSHRSMLGRFDKSLPSSHIEECDLPDKYRQSISNCSSRVGRFISGSEAKLIRDQYSNLKHSSLYQLWASEDGSYRGALVYSFLGPYVILSKDKGKTWTEPLYLGLHRLPDFTYLILSESRLPLLDQDRENVLVEVTVWEKDKSNHGGRLSGLNYREKRWHRMLKIPLSVIVNDADDDGLTDLFEERILTNPKTKDTDGDGIGDAVDNQPLEAFPDTLSVYDEVLLASTRKSMIMRTVFGHPPSEVSWELNRESFQWHLNREGVAYYLKPSKEKIPVRKTYFVAAESAVFSHITGDTRFIVLGSEARKKYIKKYGREFEPQYVTVELLIGEDTSAGYLELEYRPYRERLMIKKKSAGWSVELVGTATFD